MLQTGKLPPSFTVTVPAQVDSIRDCKGASSHSNSQLVRSFPCNDCWTYFTNRQRCIVTAIPSRRCPNVNPRPAPCTRLLCLGFTGIPERSKTSHHRPQCESARGSFYGQSRHSSACAGRSRFLDRRKTEKWLLSRQDRPAKGRVGLEQQRKFSTRRGRKFTQAGPPADGRRNRKTDGTRCRRLCDGFEFLSGERMCCA